MIIQLKRTRMNGRSILLFIGMLLACLAFAEFTSSIKAYASTASYVGSDTTTQGSWKSAYGNDGYVLNNYTGTGADIQSLPAYISSYAYTGQSTFSWGTTSDTKALEPISGSRMSTTVYSATNFTVTLNASDSSNHSLALYFDDFDNFSRTGTVEILDMSNNVLDTRSISNYYTQPLYLKYTVSGSIKVRLTNTHQNIVLMGIFWGGAYGTSWTASTGFSSTQGLKQWSYQSRLIGGSTYTNAPNYSSPQWWTSTVGSTAWIGAGSFHPDNSRDAVRTWVAPSTGTISITGRAYKGDIGGGNGVIVSVLKNSTSLWSQTIAYNDSTGYTTDASLASVAVTAGDSIRFIVNNNGDWAFDQTNWDPTIAYQSTTTFTTPVNDRTTGTGQNQFEYVGTWSWDHGLSGADNADAYYSNVSWSNTTNDYLQVRFTGTKIRFYGKLAPHHGIGAVSIDGGAESNIDFYAATNTYKVLLYTSPVLSNGTHTLKVRVPGLKNASSTGYYVVPDYVEIDSPSAPISTWNLNTTDTNLQLGVFSNGPAIISLKNPAQAWNWTPQTRIVPLLTTVYIGSTAYTPNWSYQDATVDTTSGTKVTLRFTSTTPVLELKSIWEAKTGNGPVETYSTIENKTGGTITYNQSDVVSADINLAANSTVTLNRFNRLAYVGSDTNPNTAVFLDTIGANSILNTVNEDNVYATSGMLPFQVFNVGSTHGLYIGYEWSFGKAALKTGSDPLAMSYVHYVWDSGTIPEANLKILKVPAVFYGTYQGDVDAGSNTMKKWFWNNEMTPTLRNNTNEPLVELHVEAYSAADWSTYFSTHNPLGLGVALVKQDAWWTSDVNTDSPFGWGWNADTTKWPSGMTLGTTTHGTLNGNCPASNCLKLSLYMANRYQHADLGTQVGRDLEKSALLYRYDNLHYDYWRSDMESDGTTHSYLMHEGLLEALDYMIANRAGFRWENCSGGGALKDFTAAQRMTFMTQEDTGSSAAGPVAQRKAFYSGSYMINSVQLKGDMNLQDSGYQTATWQNYAIRSQMLGAMMNNAITTLQETTYASNITLYNTKQRAILRGGDVYHILPTPDGTNWDGIEFFNTTLNKGSVFLFHPSTTVSSSQTIYFKGLVAGTTYTITFQDRTAQNTTKTGAQLAAGLSVTGMTGDYASEIIWIN